jgi:hypothetical protein
MQGNFRRNSYCFVTASGNSGDVIEWYDSQESSTILKTGSIFSPVIGKTTTFMYRADQEVI